MKTRTLVSILILVLAALIISEGFATEKKVTKRDYKFFSETWINEEYNKESEFPAKLVIRRDGTFDAYFMLSDKKKYRSGIYEIVEKWTDSEGNIWYKRHVWGGAKVEGHPGGYALDKFSNSGNVWEYIESGADFPTEIDKNHPYYHRYNRQE